MMSLQAPESGCFNALARDIRGLAYLIFWLLTEESYFKASTWEGMCLKHDEWVSCRISSARWPMQQVHVKGKGIMYA